MLRKLLRIDDVQRINSIEPFFRLGWPLLVLLLAVAAAVLYVAYLYHRERMISKGKRVLLGTIRSVIFAIIILLLFEPVLGLNVTVDLPRTVLVLRDASDSMNIKDDRVRPADQREAALAMGKLSYDNPFANVSALPEDDLQAVSAVSRLQMANSLLNHPTERVFENMAKTYEVRHFDFAEKLVSIDNRYDGNTPDPGDQATWVGSSLDEALSRFSGQSISAVIILTDGASNGGLEPLEIASRMKERLIPLYPIGLGLAAPPDIRIDAMLLPETVFVKDKVPVRVQISALGFAGRPADVVLKAAGKEVGNQRIKLIDGTKFIEFTFQPTQKSDATRLEVTVSPAGPGITEAALENNSQARSIRVIDEKIKVLYIEGKPRWEYRYLRRVLLRDHRLDIKFIMTEGDKELAQKSERYLATFPIEADKAFKFDLVIIGDVPKNYFTKLQMSRIEQLVRERGGSMLMLAGFSYAPVDYVGTPIAKMLPVRITGDGWSPVGDLIYPKPTPEGDLSAVTALEVPSRRNEALWELVKPLFKLPNLDGIKQGATTLLELSDKTTRGDYPLIAWQRYGAGKTLYAGTDQLWRLRYKRGDKYHARFWGQTIQFLTLSRLLGGNKRIRLETDRNEYRIGQRVKISANVLDEAYTPVRAESFQVALYRRGPEARANMVGLVPVPGMPGFFQGFFVPEKAGAYDLTAPGTTAEQANTSQFNVEAVSLERQEPAMREDMLRQMAEMSGGQYLTAADLPLLGKLLSGEKRRTSVKYSRELFDLPIAFAILIVLLTAEWLLRRRFDLV